MWKLKIGEGGNNPWLRSTNGHLGRQVWEFHPELGTSDEISQVEKAREEFRRNRFKTKNSSDLLLRLQYSKGKQTYMDLPPQKKLGESDYVTEEVVSTSIRRALSSFSTLQAHDGHWPADFGAPMFLLPGLIITLYITGALNTLLSTEHVSEMRRFLYNHQNEDGGWGFHIEGHSTMFGSVLSYVTLRLLGEEAEGGDGAISKGREWILQHGGATHTTQWGKFWLSVLGAFDWAGNNPLLPELMLLPQILPFHPKGKMVQKGSGSSAEKNLSGEGSCAEDSHHFCVQTRRLECGKKVVEPSAEGNSCIRGDSRRKRSRCWLLSSCSALIPAPLS